MLIPLFGVGWTEVLVIAGVIFVLFGASRIPAAFRSFGEGIKSFKDGLEGPDEDSSEGEKSPPKTKRKPAAARPAAEESESED